MAALNVRSCLLVSFNTFLISLLSGVISWRKARDLRKFPWSDLTNCGMVNMNDTACRSCSLRLEFDCRAFEACVQLFACKLIYTVRINKVMSTQCTVQHQRFSRAFADLYIFITLHSRVERSSGMKENVSGKRTAFITHLR
jgi:hypothetical protein